MAGLSKHLQDGDKAETYAADFLQSKGLQLLHKNFSSAGGEIDLIMQDREDLVFVEVRLRNNTAYGSAVESVNYYKQNKIIRTGLYYMQKQRLLYRVNCRFDIVGISTGVSGPEIEWVKNAFSPR